MGMRGEGMRANGRSPGAGQLSFSLEPHLA